jgi:hypothetical protein
VWVSGLSSSSIALGGLMNRAELNWFLSVSSWMPL